MSPTDTEHGFSSLQKSNIRCENEVNFSTVAEAADFSITVWCG
jgi:hypothetical protein